MFVQVIEGHVQDPQRVREGLDQWVRDLSPSAQGWLGTTAGVTDDGQFVAMACFDSPEAARRNSDRPEQGRWWNSMSSNFTGEPVFHDCPDCFSAERGQSNAHFVQVIKGHVRDADRIHALSDQAEPMIARERPEILGDLVALDPSGDFVEAVYFTDEPSAREGERKPMPDELKKLFDEEMSLTDDMSYLDLRQVWLYSPRQ
ncbi:MAG TPA: hypothetical protein VF054_14970 [Micromonosporaceae bacterium]